MKTTYVQPEHNVSFEHQRQLAKLLAKENIRVRQGNYKTAFFDVKNRVLGLPTWNLKSKDVSDLLVGHEIGHARWTPEDGIEQYHKRFGKEAPFDIANIVEDIRIERRILVAFPGLVSSFTKGYTYLLENDFFGKFEDGDMGKLNFIDRLNLKGKLRHLINIEFDEWETEIYNKCMRAETYEEVLDICGEIIEKLPKEKQPEQQPEQQLQESPSSGDPEDEDEVDDDSMNLGQGQPKDESDESDSESSESDQTSQPDDESDPTSTSDESQDGEEESMSKSDQTSESSEEADEGSADSNGTLSGDDGIDYSDAISETQRALEEELENSQEDLKNDLYVDAPNREQINSCISPLDKVREERKNRLSVYNELMTNPEYDFKWKKFKNDSKKNVALLVREFERKKSAYEYSRARTSATGSLDPNKLHTYKYDEQIFKSVTRLATSKDHGMIFFVDWSGSMGQVIHDVIQQTLQLAFFCKAVGIPFAVYGFTTSYSKNSYSIADSNQIGNVVDMSATSVFELINSTINKREFEDACKELFLSCYQWGNRFDSDLESLGGTPLFDTILCATEIVKNFRAKYNVQKLHTMFLTDGESSRMNYHQDNSFEKPAEDSDSENHHRRWHSKQTRKEFLRWGNTLIGPDAFKHRGLSGTYRQLILNFKRITGSSAICFFLGSPRNARAAATNAIIHSSAFKSDKWEPALEEYKTVRKQTVKDKSRTVFIEDGLGYDGYFIIETSKVAIEDTELEVDENLDYSKPRDINILARKFSTQSKDKRASRVFLSKFSDLIS